MKEDEFISVVSPLLNQAAILRDFVRETHDILERHYTNYEIILVNGTSSDDTHDVIDALLQQYSCLRFIQLTSDYGKDISIYAGLEQAIGDYVVVLFPDSDPPGMIPETVRMCRESQRIVYGSLKTPARDPLAIEALSWCFRSYCERFLKLTLPRFTTDYRVLSRQVVNAVTRIKDRYPFVKIYGSAVGFGSRPYVYEPLHRSGASPRRSVLQRINEAVEIIMSSSKQPLRLASRLGLLAGVLYVAWTAAVSLVAPPVGGAADSLALLLPQSLMMLIVLATLAILCEYLGRVLEESRSRPLYHVLFEKESNVMISDDRRNVQRQGVRAQESAPDARPLV
jgi:glycosyltransferase involved in cell wall biosynthesis